MRFMSIGSNCAAAFTLQAHNLRGEAMPFDWLTVTAQGLLACLRDDFARFLTELQPCDTAAGAGSGVQDAYGFKFAHDFRTRDGKVHSETRFLSTPYGGTPTTEDAPATASEDDHFVAAGVLADDWEADVDAVRTKYARRIARFRETFRGGGDVVLLCSGGDAKNVFDVPWAREFLEVLRAAYPATRARLLLVNTHVHPLDSCEGKWRSVQQSFSWGVGAACGLVDALDAAHTI